MMECGVFESQLDWKGKVDKGFTLLMFGHPMCCLHFYASKFILNTYQSSHYQSLIY